MPAQCLLLSVFLRQRRDVVQAVPAADHSTRPPPLEWHDRKGSMRLESPGSGAPIGP